MREASPPLAEEPIMPVLPGPKTVTLPGDCAVAIAALEAHVREHDLPLGRAAAELIERGAKPLSTPAPVPEQPAPVVALEDVHLDALLAEVKRRFELLPAGEALDAANARADAAEGRLARFRELLDA